MSDEAEFVFRGAVDKPGRAFELEVGLEMTTSSSSSKKSSSSLCGLFLVFEVLLISISLPDCLLSFKLAEVWG